MNYRFKKSGAGFVVEKLIPYPPKSKYYGETRFVPQCWGNLEVCSKKMLEMAVADGITEDVDNAKVVREAVKQALSVVVEVVRAVEREG